MYTLRYLLLVVIPICFIAEANSQPEYPLYRKADKEFDGGFFQEAETNYRKAEEIKPKPEASYNLGNSIYMQNRMPEAVSQYQKTIEQTSDPSLKSNAYYNMGNAHFQNKEYEDAIKNYKDALKLTPTDEDAKKNLMLAMRQLQQQQQQQQKDQQKKDDNKDQQNQDQQQQQQQQQQPSEKDKKEQQQDSKDPSQQDQQPKEDISKDEAKEILKAVEREDQRVQEKLKKVAGNKAPPVKDW